MDLFLLFLLAASMVVYKPELVDCCFPGGRLIRRMPKKEPALVYKQHVPNLPENALTASGPREGRIRRHDRRFNELVANHNPDIIFKDEELTGADRLMSLRCKEKLDALSMLVTNYWPGIKLRVTDAWDEDGLHPADSLHYEGRAVDVTTSDKDRAKYGMLARLAAQAGFDWVYYEVRSHVHASVKSDTSTRNKRALRCFPENATVLTKSGKRVQMRDLKLGDLVLSLDERLRPSFAAVVTNLHVDRVSTSEFVLVVTSSGAGLTISGDHLLYVVDGSYATNGSVRMKPVFAKDLSSHDRAIVYNENENDFTVERIVRTEPITARGLYAPLTTNGRLVVDDVAVSCFAGVVSEATARAVSAPLRWWCKFSDDYLPSNFAIAAFSQLRTREGIVWYAYALQLLAELMDKLNIVTLLVAS